MNHHPVVETWSVICKTPSPTHTHLLFPVSTGKPSNVTCLQWCLLRETVHHLFWALAAVPHWPLPSQSLFPVTCQFRKHIWLLRGLCGKQGKKVPFAWYYIHFLTPRTWQYYLRWQRRLRQGLDPYLQTIWSYTLKTPKNSTQKLLDTINSYSKVAVYKINIEKSLAFLYTNNEQTEKEYMKTIPFTIASKKKSDT
jgi:hypothetical protein